MLERLRGYLDDLITMSDIDPGVPILGEDELRERIEGAEPTMVLFYADWCGFCRAFAEPFRENVDEVPHDTVAANISDQSDPRWKRHDVSAVPTLVAFREGEEIARADARPGRGLEVEDLERLVDEID